MKDLFHHSARFIQGRFFFLLASLILLIIVAPFLREYAVASWLIGLSSVFILAAVIHAVQHERKITIVFFSVMAILTVVFSFLELLYHTPLFNLVSMSLYIVFFLASIFALHSEVYGSDEITGDSLYGSICVYLLIGVMYGSVYMFLETLHPGSFQHNVSLEKQTFTQHQMYYYSFVTLTTLGFGDILPTSLMAKSITMIESITGIFYLAILVSRLVAQQLRGK